MSVKHKNLLLECILMSSSVVLRVYVMFWNTVEKKVKLLLIAKMSEGIKWTK